MTTRGFAALLLLAAVPGLPVAQAQTETGTRLGFKRSQIPDFKDNETRTRFALDQLARCAIELNESRARKLIVPYALSEEASDSATMLSDDQCLSEGEIRFSGVLLQGAVFSNLYRKDFGKRPVPDFEGVSLPPVPAAAPGTTEGAYAALREAVECAVRAAPASARELAMSKVASPFERKALREMGEALGPCILAGSKVTITPTMLRATTSDVLYRLTLAKTQAAG